MLKTYSMARCSSKVPVIYPRYEHKSFTGIQLLGTQHPDPIGMLPHYETISPYAHTFREARACSEGGQSGQTGGCCGVGDVGASGCVIEKEAADALGLERFGDIAVSGMAGRIQSCFRRAASIQLGPVTMKGCLFM